MSAHAAETSLRTQIVVEAPIERAFSVFTEDFGSFKPPEHNLLEVEIAETVFETHVGGSVYDRGVDASEELAATLAALGNGLAIDAVLGLSLRDEVFGEMVGYLLAGIAGAAAASEDKPTSD